MFQNLTPCLNGQSYVWYHESHVSHMFQNLMPCLNGQSYVWYHESHVSHMIQIKCHMLNMASHMFGTMCHMFHMFLSYEAYVCHMFAKKYIFLDIFLIFQNVPVSYVSVICHMVFIWFSYVFHMFVICRLPSSGWDLSAFEFSQTPSSVCIWLINCKQKAAVFCFFYKLFR